MSNFDFDDDKYADTPNNMEVMIDIESLGTVAGSPIVTIGAVLFDPRHCDDSKVLYDRSLHVRIDISEAVNISRGVEGGTIRWWFEQDNDAIKALVSNDCVTVREALEKLWRYCCERGTFVDTEFFNGLSGLPKCSGYWAKDPDFDMQLLRYYYELPEIKTPMPWKFWECRSVRTVQHLAWSEGPHVRPDFEIPGIAHNARWDAIEQAMTVQAAYKELGISIDGDVAFGKYEPPTQEEGKS